MEAALMSDTKLSFESLSFAEQEQEVVITFMKLFQFKIPREDLMSIADFELENNAIIFKNIDEPRARKKFNILLFRGFQNLTNTLTKKPTTYIHQYSGIPLMGTVYFGFIDRDTNIIEIRTITGCNIDCVYCSVDEHQRARDFIIEKDYLIQELRKHLEMKECNAIEAHINPQAEPFLYSDLVPLIRDLAAFPQIKTISINTNATFLTNPIIDKLAEAGLTRINFSLNSLNKETAQKMAGAPINIEQIKKAAQYASKKMDINIAPVLMKGYNETDIPEIISFANELQKNTSFTVRVGIQNYLLYKHGKSDDEVITMPEFYQLLKKWEQEFDINLTPDFGIISTLPIPKPFKTGDIITAEVVADGRFPREKIAVAKNRAIVVKNCQKQGRIKIKIIRCKDNVFSAVPA